MKNSMEFISSPEKQVPIQTTFEQLCTNSKLSQDYRNDISVVKNVFDAAWSFLLSCTTPEQRKLPINVAEIAKKLGLEIIREDLTVDYWNDARTISSLAELHLNFNSPTQIEAGTIIISENLSSSWTRFSIAHELGHFILCSPSGYQFYYEACPGLYPLSGSDELLSDLFAYAMLLPYPLFLELKHEYEEDSSRWPIDFSDWIAFLKEKTQMPEYHAVLAYHNIRKYAILLRIDEAKRNTSIWIYKLIEKLLELKLTRSEIKSILIFDSPNEEIVKLQERLTETIDLIRSNDVEPCTAEFKWEPDFIAWKKQIVENLLDYGFSDKDLNEFYYILDIQL